MGEKAEKMPNICPEVLEGDIAQHNLTRGEAPGREREVSLMLPMPPEKIKVLVQKMYPRSRPSSTDKLCLILSDAHRISQRQRNGKWKFEVSHSWAEQIVSRIGGRRPLVVLCELGLIEKDRPHRASILPKAITYRFKVRTFKKYILTFKGKAAVKSCMSGARGKDRRKKDQVESWIAHSLNRVGLPDEILQDYLSRPGYKKNAKRFADGGRPQKWNGAYRWNVICQMPADLRERLVFDGEDPVRLLDISSSFPTMLSWLFEDDVNYALSKRKISSREAQKRMIECQELKDFLSRKDPYTELLPERSRQEAKQAFQRFLNTKQLDPLARKVGRNFEEKFSVCYRMIQSRKVSKISKTECEKSSLSRELLGRQSEIINAVILRCRESSIPCVPVWDELIVSLVDGLDAQRWIQEEIFLRTGVKAKVGGVRESQPFDSKQKSETYNPAIIAR